MLSHSVKNRRVNIKKPFGPSATQPGSGGRNPSLDSFVVYAGDGSYWIRHKGTSRSRNPDFVILKPKQLKAYQEG